MLWLFQIPCHKTTRSAPVYPSVKSAGATTIILTPGGAVAPA